jgi:hypothetical protein
MKYVALFFCSVIALMIVGLGCGYLSGNMLLSYLSEHGRNDPSAVNEYPWLLIYSMVVYFLAFFVLMHIGIFYAFRRKIKIDVLYSQAAEYAYLILTIAGLFTIADTVPTLVNVLIAKSKNEIENTLYLTQGTSSKNFFCRGDLSSIGALECSFLSKISPLREEDVTQDLINNLEKILSNITDEGKKRDSESTFDALKASKEELDNHRSYGTDVIPKYRIYLMYIRNILVDKQRVATLIAYKPPDIIFKYKFIASYVLAFSLALRLTRASAEALKLIAK